MWQCLYLLLLPLPFKELSMGKSINSKSQRTLLYSRLEILVLYFYVSKVCGFNWLNFCFYCCSLAHNTCGRIVAGRECSHGEVVSVSRSLSSLLCSVQPPHCQSFSHVSLYTPFPPVGRLKGPVLQGSVALPLSQKILSGSFFQHCHHWLHSQPVLTWSWEWCNTGSARKSPSVSGGLKNQNQRTLFGRCKCWLSMLALWKISLKQRNQNTSWSFDFWWYWSRFCANTSP